MKTMDERLQELLDLPRNWDSYGSCRISKKATKSVKEFMNNVHFAPLPNGGIELTWLTHGIEVLLTFNKEGVIEDYLIEGADGIQTKKRPQKRHKRKPACFGEKYSPKSEDCKKCNEDTRKACRDSFLLE